MKRNMAHAFRSIELEQGDASERYLAEVLQKSKDAGKLPPWLLSWERTEKWSIADRRGVDFFIRTDKGDIRINVKSSRIFAKQFEDRHRNGDILPIVVNLFERLEAFLGRFISLISKARRSM